MCRALRAFAGLVESPDEEDYDCFASAGAPAGAQGAKLRFPAFPQRTVPGPDKRLPVGVVLLGRLESALHRRPPLCSDSRSFPAPCVPGRRADAISERPGQASNAMRRKPNDDAEASLLLERPQGAARNQSDDDAPMLGGFCGGLEKQRVWPRVSPAPVCTIS